MKPEKRKRSTQYWSLIAALLPPQFMLAQATEAPVPVAQRSDLLFNPTFWLLSMVVVFLFIAIVVLDGVVKSARKYRVEIEKKKSGIAPVITALMVLGYQSLWAQTPTVTEPADCQYWGLSSLSFFTFLTIIFIELVVIFRLYALSLILLGARKVAGYDVHGEQNSKPQSFLEVFNASVAIEHEADILLDHDYDGIKELDNNLPPWWKYGFYVTIIFSVIYLVNFHFSGNGKLQVAEYEEQMAIAKAEVEAYKKKADNLVDENTVTLLKAKADIEAGKKIFLENCSACHGKLGEGGVGPNLTDDYWIHQGGIKDIFKTVKFGWPEKGMKAWEQDLSARQIQEVSSFIKTLQGTTPPNPKEKQGELYTEGATAAPQSKDSTAVAAK